MQGTSDSASAANINSETEICERIRQRINAAGLWQIPGLGPQGARTHLISPQPFSLSPKAVDLLHKLGNALLAFYSATNDLYLRAGNDWVNNYLDTGKPEDLIRHAHMNYQKRALPAVIRPDILMMDDGFSITELDSVPGGMGQLDCLSSAYEDAGFNLIGSPRGMRNGYAAILKSVSGKEDPVCAIVVSDESEDYRPEMNYLGGELRNMGFAAYTVHPKEVIFAEDGLFIDADGEKLRVDIIYRFFELFDLLNIPKAELISYAARKKITAITPPYKPYLEEKMLLALLHSEALAKYWKKSLGEENFGILKDTISPTYIFDNRPVPPHAEISGFRWQGSPIRDWHDIKSGTQKERRLVLKPSGFSPYAWGSRGVKIGHDLPEVEWSEAVDEALESFNTTPYVLQPFRETALIGVKYQNESGDIIRQMQARVRLCPYYFVINGRAELGGVLATSVPKDKKLVHGMVDAVMSPCWIEKAR